jgi:hypothetical protein
VAEPTAAVAAKNDSDRLGVILETCKRDAEAAPGKVQELKEEAGQALRSWAKVTDKRLASMRRRISRGHGLMSVREAQDHWELLNQLKNDIYSYVEDRDSLLEDYEPLQRAAAPELLQPFWERFDAAFDKLEWHKDTLSKYSETYRQQSTAENRNYEQQSRDDSRLVRDKLREFIDLACALMQVIGKL